MSNRLNPNSGTVHYQGEHADEPDDTLCGVTLRKWKPVTSPVTCQRCREIAGDTSELSDEYWDPDGIMDDDLPDGAYFAMHWEHYGW